MPNRIAKELVAKKIRPLFTKIVTTADKWEGDRYDEHGLVQFSLNPYKPYQTVVEAGNNAAGLKKGDLVYIDFIRYMIPKHRPDGIQGMGDRIAKDYNFDKVIIYIDGVQHLLLESADVVYVIEEWEEKELSERAKAAAIGLAVPPENKIIC